MDFMIDRQYKIAALEKVSVSWEEWQEGGGGGGGGGQSLAASLKAWASHHLPSFPSASEQPLVSPP